MMEPMPSLPDRPFGDDSARRTHSVLSWVSLVVPFLLWFKPFNIHWLLTIAVGVAVAVAALVEASYCKRRRALPRVVLAYWAALLLFGTLMASGISN